MKELLKTIISDFHNKLPIQNITPRQLQVPVQPKQIITLIGPRRCGKTYYFYSIINKLIEIKENKNLILYFNFEDERYDLTTDDMQLLLDAYFEIYPQNIDKKLYCFFDEIQEVKNWEKFIRRIKDTINPYIFITGSSSKMLSSDIATALRGRSITFQLYPFSFVEYCNHLNLPTGDITSTKNKTQLFSFFQDFLINGGYPDVVDQPEHIKSKILQSYFNVMIYKDIIERYSISNHAALKQFIKHLSSTISSEFSINKIYNDLKSSNVTISKNQLYAFLDYTQDCFLFFLNYPLKFSSKQSLKSKKKIYFIDNGLLMNITSSFSNNFGKLLENLVFIELKRREKEMFFFRNAFECDFIITKHNRVTELLQVSWDESNQRTLAREIKPLLHLSEKYPDAELMILTNSTEKIMVEGKKQIKITPVWKWCLQSK